MVYLNILNAYPLSMKNTVSHYVVRTTYYNSNAGVIIIYAMECG